MSFEISIRILTKGERSEIINKVKNVKEFFEKLEVDFSISVSLNIDPENPPIPNLVSNLTAMEVFCVQQDYFIDSVEQHMLKNYLDADKSNQNRWIWLMDDSDSYDFTQFEYVIKNLENSQVNLIFLNNSMTNELEIESEPRIMVLDREFSDLTRIVLNSGPTQAVSKMGAWIVRCKLLEEDHLNVWESWLSHTILWTHAYFYLYLTCKFPSTGVFIRQALIKAAVNPTDTDRHSNWLNWHKRTNKIFQQDWTFGQTYLLQFFYRSNLLSLQQIRYMIVSCSQRGVMPLYNDILFRILINQLREACFSKNARLNANKTETFFEFLSQISPKDKVIHDLCKTVLSESNIEPKVRLRAYKYAFFLYHQSSSDPWRHFRITSLLNYGIYRRQSDYVAIHRQVNPQIVFRDSSQMPMNNSLVKSAIELEELVQYIESKPDKFYTQARELEFWENPKFNPEMRLYRFQILLLRMSYSRVAWLQSISNLIVKLISKIH